MNIAKITNTQEFIDVCQILAKLSETPETAKVSDKNELKMKIEVYIRKFITDYTNSSKD